MEPDDRTLDLHWLLLRLAGSLPDELIAQCRMWLAEGRHADIGRAVTHAVVSQRHSLTEGDVSLLGQLLTEVGADSSALSLVDVDEFDAMPMHGFVPGRAVVQRVLAGPAEAEELTSVEQVAAAEPEDDVDRAAIAAAQRAQVGAVWRAWRFPGDGSPWPAPRRVYVVESTEVVDLAQVAAGLQSVLVEAGEVSPQVEVYPVHAELPSYQRMARAYGALIWSRTPDPGIRIARLFDEVDPETGPSINADHPTVDDEEFGRLVEYLRRGEALLVTTARMDDVVDTSRVATVPMNFVTDGHWIWTDASTYYLEQYRYQPDPDLVDHIRSRDYQFTDVDGAGIHRALAVLQEPTTEEPAWTYG